MLSLNLLPEQRKKVLDLRQRFRQWREPMVLVFVSCGLAVVAMVGIDWSLAEQVSSSTQDLASWQELHAKRESGQVTQATKKLNATVDGLNEIFNPVSFDRTQLVALLKALPPDISVSAFSLEPDGAFTVTGIAATRTSFLALRNALGNPALVTEVVTTSTATQREKLPFEYSGRLVLTP